MIPNFRFYNIKLNKIYEVAGIDFFNEQVDCLLPELNNDISFWDFNVGILMQSTVLFDKNGKEIFEGDVVNIHAFYFDGCSESEQELIGIMRYGKIAGFLIKEWYLETVDNKIAFSDLELHEESFEVLGNIYEHKYLLWED